MQRLVLLLGISRLKKIGKDTTVKLLSNPDHVMLDDVRKLKWALKPVEIKHSIPETRQPCENLDEKLAEIVDIAYLDAYFALDILPARKPLIRSGLLTRLQIADNNLPEGFNLLVLDAWRSITEQEILIDYYSVQAVAGGFVASIDDNKMRPPHTTGGAVDVTLAYHGEPLALGTEFDSFGVEASTNWYEVNAETSSDEKIRTLRRILFQTMKEAGFISYPLEWWHYSYGDDVWGFTNSRQALYEIMTSPRPEE